tara:strand:+ start:204 stop:368 length:165 start_codon:yes stop_codon:yes gene_type:complete
LLLSENIPSNNNKKPNIFNISKFSKKNIEQINITMPPQRGISLEFVKFNFLWLE